MPPSHEEETPVPAENRVIKELLTPPKRPSSRESATSHTKEDYQLPKEWTEITAGYLKKQQRNLTTDSIAQYLNVREPKWEDVLSPKIPSRQIVNDLVQRIKNKSEGRHLTVLIAPGCEGKSTVLRQTICKLVQEESNYQILWHEAQEIDKVKLQEDLIKLPKSHFRKRWLVVIDDPSRQCINAINMLFSKNPLNRRDMQFLICCRDTFWKNYGEKLKWEQRQEVILLPRLTEPEATNIVDVWSEAGKLLEDNTVDAVRELLKQQKSGKPVFLAAMLKICTGQTLEQQISDILDDIQNQANGQYLLDAYLCIIAMHVENLKFLSFDVLAKFINYSDNKLKRDILEKLGNEIIIDERNKLVFTRHQTIAEEAYKVLCSPPYSIDFKNDIYPRLAEAAQNLITANQYREDRDKWQLYFPDNFVDDQDKTRNNVAISISKTLYDIGKTPKLLTNLAKICRISQNKFKDKTLLQESIKCFRESPRLMSQADKILYHEWAIAELESGNNRTSILLFAIGLSDHIPLKFDGKFEINGETTMIYLSSIGLALYNLCKENSDCDSHTKAIYGKALYASGQLGCNGVEKVKKWFLNKKRETTDYLLDNRNRAIELGYNNSQYNYDFEKLFSMLQDGIKIACEAAIQETKNLPTWLEKFDQLKFNLWKTEMKSLGNGY